MTPQEQQLLQGLVDRVNETVLQEKDPDAEQFIQQSLSRNPDALYILAQTVLVQQYALDQAKKQLDEAKQQAAQAVPPKHATSFLGNLLGMNDEPAARPAPPPPPPQAQYAPVQTYAPQQGYVAQPTYPAQPMGGGGSWGGWDVAGWGFLQSAMRTATGVAAGALAFEGIESLMHGFGQHAGYGSGFEGMGGGQPREEIVNNYYGDSAGEHGRQGDLGDRFAASGDQASPDVEDRRDNGASNFADTSSGDDSETTVDDSSYDDSSDSSSDFDSGSSDDSSL